MTEEKTQRPDNQKVNIRSHVEDIERKSGVSVSPNLSTLAADHVKVLLDDECQLCTFTFFRRHVKPKQTDDGVLLDSLNDEMFLEVKVPYESAFALSLYMEDAYKKIQELKADGHAGTRFGPGKLS